MLQAINRIAGEPRNGFGDDVVDFPRVAVLYHLLELRPFVGPCSRYSLISIDTSQFPIRPGSDHLSIHLLLRCIRGKLFFAIRRYTTICGNPLLMIFGFVHCQCSGWIYARYCFLSDLRCRHDLQLLFRLRFW